MQGANMSDDFDLWDVFLSMFWFMLLFAWISLIIHIFSDLFRDRSLSGGAKALWALLLVFLPWVGALVYLIARGRSMNERAQQAAEAQEASLRAYVQEAAGSPSPADELRKLAELRDSGVITPADYETAKAKVLA
jgi:Short C-terminal domain/Phospholipase_D-nuclease N-terminal